MLAKRVLDLDFDEIGKWFESRGSKLPDISFFPRCGFIVHGIAAGFIYFTDSSIAIIDCYVSNPDSNITQRGDALDLITKALIEQAQFHKCKMLKCDTKLEAVKQRALSHGFKSLGAHESFSLEI